MERKILKAGVIGLNMGKAHAEGICSCPDACLYAVCDSDADTANQVGTELGAEHIYTDYKKMISNPELEAVVIAVPDQLHREMVVDVLHAGKHILCEKPLALTREDCADILEAVKRSSVKFMVGQICRYTPGFKKAKEIIDSGAIGELTFVESEYAHDYISVFAQKHGSWRCDPICNGVVGGGCHAVDLLRWVAGNPREITAYGTHKTFAGITPYDDTHIAIMRFPNGVIGKVFVSISCKRDYTMRSVFYGTRGTIVADNTSSCLTVFRDEAFPRIDSHTMPIRVPVDVNSHNASAEFFDFCSCVLRDTPIETTALEGANTVAACLSIVESANTGKPVIPQYFN